MPENIFSDLCSLITLHLTSNRITSLTPGLFTNLTNLTALVLTHNKIRILPSKAFSGLHNLAELYIDSNSLVKLDSNVFDDLYSLKSLALFNNFLVRMPRGIFKNLQRLELLSLPKNSLEGFDAELLEGMARLKVLDLSINRLTKLDFDIFKETPSIFFLDLAENGLNNIPDMAYLSQLRFLYLNQNPLKQITWNSFSDLSENIQMQVSQHEICECYNPENVNCSASNDRSPYLTCDRLLSDRVLVVMMWLIGLNALFGNMLVLIWRKKVTKSFKVQDLFLFNLAMSDFLMGIYMIIIASADVVFGDNFPLQSETWRSSIVCRLAGAIAIISSEASVFFVTLISIDRFLCICFPFSVRTNRKKMARVIISVTWVISLALGIVPSAFAAGHKNFKFYDNSHVCIGLPLVLIESYSNQELRQIIDLQDLAGGRYVKSIFITTFNGLVTGMFFSTAVFLGLNCICYLIILVCYISIIQSVKRSSKRAGRTREMKEQIKLTVKITAIVATDFLCWFPVIIMGILVQTRVITLPPSAYAWLVTFVLPINSAINPYLYTLSEFLSHRRQAKRRNTLSTEDSNSAAQLQLLQKINRTS